MKTIKIIRKRSAIEAEVEINNLRVHNFVNILGFQCTNETITIMIDIENK